MRRKVAMSYKNDIDAIRAFKRGEESGFNFLLDRYESSAYSLALCLLDSESQVEEVLEEVFSQFFFHIRTIEPEGFSSKEWICNQVVKLTKVVTSISSETYQKSKKPDHTSNSVLKSYMAQLSPARQAAFALHFLVGLKVKSTSSLLTTSPQQLRYGLSKSLSA